MKKELKESIEKSGNKLHLETAAILEKNEWNVDLSSYYYDDTQRKPREIDIIADKDFSIKNEGKEVGKFKLFLFIECKYLKSDIGFIMRENNRKQAEEAMIFSEINKDKNLFSYLEGMHDYGSNKFTHHYLKDEFVGKLYNTTSEDENKIFNALTQPIKSLIFFQESLYKMEPEVGVKKAIYYPLVVYSGIDGIYPIEEYDNLNDLKTKEGVIFALNYSYKSPTKTKTVYGAQVPILTTQPFYIDFVKKDALGRFLSNVIGQEAKRFQRYFSSVEEQKDLNKNI